MWKLLCQELAVGSRDQEAMPVPCWAVVVKQIPSPPDLISIQFLNWPTPQSHQEVQLQGRLETSFQLSRLCRTGRHSRRRLEELLHQPTSPLYLPHGAEPDLILLWMSTARLEVGRALGYLLRPRPASSLSEFPGYLCNVLGRED